MTNNRVIALIATAGIAAAVCAILRQRRCVPSLMESEVPHSEETVQAASEDSFPASDPPAWTGAAV
jgi:hypothetical protein